MKTINLLLILTLSLSNTVFSQQEKNVFIVVKDSNNNPIPNAVVLFDDVKQTSKTDSKGIFKGTSKKNIKKMTAFSPLHGINTINYDGKKYNRIIIKSHRANVTIQKPSNVIVQNSMSSFQYKDIYDYINGQVPGVTVINKTITVRGSNSINGSTIPLFVVNKMQVAQEIFANISPADIKRIKVLKGTDTAIYGVRGANGVIEVTTN